MSALDEAFQVSQQSEINILGFPIHFKNNLLNERKENPQAYDFLPSQYVHQQPQRHILGLIGGNETSLIAGNLVDLESDLRGITIPNTFAPWRQYQPPTKKTLETGKLIRKNTKTDVEIDIRQRHLPSYQMWAYPGVQGPTPMVSEVCRQPEKY